VLSEQPSGPRYHDPFRHMHLWYARPRCPFQVMMGMQGFIIVHLPREVSLRWKSSGENDWLRRGDRQGFFSIEILFWYPVANFPVRSMSPFTLIRIVGGALVPGSLSKSCVRWPTCRNYLAKLPSVLYDTGRARSMGQLRGLSGAGDVLEGD
jgi:hypothetical protein